mmetsp:Transcript_51967/g.70902  ORF Transcript_51967/g.70902 Transcript_51967/m.70902 type:complete len:174 (-) Transcript_51967:410-931(-)|eukprot:CAMPEP_0185755632 /NCGR_PEP_ID=MMETSP1174-20130828/14108_1 /TAXON_ID=35687 /ORGANISM="Dictyocha speculum, Strain CCMP1381" /LENGTH=173 /DNA_ID=CAMNT_0028434265 /DNA_START=395 /DNA_END=916 /DNA_ORIENTATION=+
MELEAGKLMKQAVQLNKAGKKDRALLCVKMKRYKESKIGEVDTQLLSLEKMVQTIQWETENLKVFNALKEGNQALDAIHSVMSIENVEELMDDTKEAIEYENEISTLLSGQDLAAIDESAVMDELDALEREMQAEAAGVLPDLPQVPTTEIAPLAENQAEPQKEPARTAMLAA